MAIAPEIFELAALIQDLTGISANINNMLSTGAQSSLLSQLIDEVQSVEELLLNANRGLSAITNNQEQILISINQSLSTTLQRVGSPQQANQPVTLPAAPPASFANALALADWNSVDPNTGNTFGALLSNAGYLYYVMASVNLRWPIYEFPYLAVVGLAQYPGGPTPNPFGGLPSIDPTTILATDATVGDWLKREYSAWNWVLPGGTTLWSTIPNVSPDGFTYLCTITPAQFEQLKAQITPSTASYAAPVWPGLANVTLGSPVALATGVTVPGPMHGVIIAITAVPQPIGYYDFNGDKSFVHVGGITFQDDHGDDEEAQPLGFAANVITPKKMTVASSALIRTQSGTVGTATPWSIT